jgi:orotate phosphoribosyltransferase
MRGCGGALLWTYGQPPVSDGSLDNTKASMWGKGVCLDAPVSISKANAERRPTTNGIEPNDLDGRDVLVVADVLSSGESIRPLVELAKRRKSVSVHLVAFAALHRDGCEAILRKLDVSGTCLMHAAWATYDRDAYPLCDAGGELIPAFELN